MDWINKAIVSKIDDKPARYTSLTKRRHTLTLEFTLPADSDFDEHDIQVCLALGDGLSKSKEAKEIPTFTAANLESLPEEFTPSVSKDWIGKPSQSGNKKDPDKSIKDAQLKLGSITRTVGNSPNDITVTISVPIEVKNDAWHEETSISGFFFLMDASGKKFDVKPQTAPAPVDITAPTVGLWYPKGAIKPSLIGRLSLSGSQGASDAVITYHAQFTATLTNRIVYDLATQTSPVQTPSFLYTGGTYEIVAWAEDQFNNKSPQTTKQVTILQN